ncbi:hypothetical protein [Leifsonia sp. fls2-241-R2A-40a]|uniref:hypothetical protein n=1 Tax=Leifsonia sp. fls2-241-R2A-40a TaxID=3040290 RepID=UPI00254B32C4|nr:hypothetical protein [Leifsonia sp. fls2-241-R2A-40a]
MDGDPSHGLLRIPGPTDRGDRVGLPDPEETKECVETVSRYAGEGWAIAADTRTLIGRLAALTTETAYVRFVAFDRVVQSTTRSSITATFQDERMEHGGFSSERGQRPPIHHVARSASLWLREDGPFRPVEDHRLALRDDLPGVLVTARVLDDEGRVLPVAGDAVPVDEGDGLPVS